MKFAALALCLLAACDGRVRYTADFASGPDEAALQTVVAAYKERLGKLAGDATFGTDAKAGTITVELPKQEASGEAFVREMLGRRGEFEFLAAAEPVPEGEHARLDAWRSSHPEARLREFDAVARAEGGPLPGLLWRKLRSKDGDTLLQRAEEPRFRFGNADVADTGFAQDSFGHPAVSFELKKERQKDFGDWTEKLLQHGMAIVRDDEILELATVNSRLPGSGIIEGGRNGFTKDEVQALVALLKQPPLPLPPLSLKCEFVR
jgi:preprotein translocase subunit SecD